MSRPTLPPRKTICKCPDDVDPFINTPNSLDNANSSTSMRLSERVRSLKPKKIYQGQPTHLEIFGATFTTAKVRFRYIGNPLYYIITVQSETDKNDFHKFQVEQRDFYNGSYKIVGLTPNTLYNVHVIANYVSGDVYPVNHDKKFRTSDAEGEVKDLTVIYPQNQRYFLQENTDYYTSFAIEFTPLNDRVDYRINLPNVLDTPVDVSYENMVIIKNTQGKYRMDFDPSVEIPFDTSYTVYVETLYGEVDDRYIYTATLPFKTLNELKTSTINLSYIYNRSAELNYSEIIDVSGVQYKIYLDTIEKYEHKTYSNNGYFRFDNLSINQSYDTQVSVIFPTTNNEYINFPYTFTTLNESESGFENVIVKNKSIDISFIDASGTNEFYDITITPTDGVVSDICYNTRNVSYTNLPINTTYTISIQVTYPPFNSFPNFTDISNVYVVTQDFTTLNQDGVTELRAVEIPKMKSDVVISYQHAPDFRKTGLNYQIQLQDKYNSANSDISLVSNQHTEYTFTDILSGTYTYLVIATYKPTDISPFYSYTVSGEIDVETLSPGFLIVSSTDTKIYGTSITFAKDEHNNTNDNKGKTNHSSYDISFVDENNESFFIEDIKTWTANTTYTIENLKSNTTYYYTIYGKYKYETPLDKYATDGSFTTLNQDKPIMLSSTVASSSIDLNFHSIGNTDVSYTIDLSGNDFNFTVSELSYNETGSSYLIDSLTPNTKYNGNISVIYPDPYNYTYNKLFHFTTLNEGPATTTVQVLYNHPVHGDVIVINNDLIQEGNVESITNELCLNCSSSSSSSSETSGTAPQLLNSSFENNDLVDVEGTPTSFYVLQQHQKNIDNWTTIVMPEHNRTFIIREDDTAGFNFPTPFVDGSYCMGLGVGTTQHTGYLQQIITLPVNNYILSWYDVLRTYPGMVSVPIRIKITKDEDSTVIHTHEYLVTNTAWTEKTTSFSITEEANYIVSFESYYIDSANTGQAGFDKVTFSIAPPPVENYTVDVLNNSIFRLDSGDGNGFVEKPPIYFAGGTNYIFDQSHASNANNTLVIGTTFDVSSSIVSSGLTIMGTPGQPGAYTKYVSDGSTVHYFSYQNENMGLASPNITDDLYVHYDFELPLYDATGTEYSRDVNGGSNSYADQSIRFYNKAYDSITNSDISYNMYVIGGSLVSDTFKVGSRSFKTFESPDKYGASRISDYSFRLDSTQGYSICFWMKEVAKNFTPSQFLPLCAFGNSGGGGGFFQMEYNDSTFKVNNNGINITYSISSLIITDWNHIAFTMSPNGPDITWKLYINGSLVNTKTDGNYLTSVNPVSGYPIDSVWIFDISAKPGGGGNNGFIDDFRFYKTELDQAQVSAVYSYTGYINRVYESGSVDIDNVRLGLDLGLANGVQETLLGSRVMFSIPNIATPYTLNTIPNYFVRTTVQYKNYDPYLFYVYESGNYVSNTDIFKPIMKDAITTVQNTSIRLDWIDYRITDQVSDSDISYSIQITDTTGNNTIADVLLDYTVQDYTIADLSMNTTYNVDFSRLYNSSLSISNEIFPTKTITTLHESYVPDALSNVLVNTMNPDKLIVFDLKNINPVQVEENKLVLDNSSEYIAHDFIIDLNLDNSITTINGKIETKYRITESNNPYIYYETKTYVSPDFSFHVLPATNVDSIEHIRNSHFDISSTDISYQFSPDTGIVRAVPPEWSGHLLYAVDNSNGTLYGHKYLDLDAVDGDIDQHMMLSSGGGFSIYLPELTQFVFDYLYRNYYEVSFYVANHLVANTPYGNKEIGHLRGTTSPIIEYQIQLVGGNGVLYESNPIVSTDTEWNKIEMKFFNPRTVRNVKLRIQRNSLELNHLYISNVSIRSLHQEFSPVPSSIQISPNKWSLVEDGPYDNALQWSKMYKNAEDQTVLQLSTNMTIGFWLYIHENRTIDKKGIFILGNSSDVNVVDLESNNIISLYLYKNKLILENQMHYSDYTRHSIEFSYTVGIPNYYQIVYQNGMVFIYQNGEKIVESTPIGYIKEASPNNVLYIGTPGQLFNGFIYRDIQFYNFPFTSTQAKSVYESLKLEYYSINNQTALLNSDKRTLVELDSLSSTNPHQDKTVDIILHNGEKLTRTIRFYEMKNDIFPFNHDNNTINSPFTISFWIITPSSLYSTYYLDGPVISLQEYVNDSVNGTDDKIIIKSVQGDLYLFVANGQLDELIVEKYWKDKNSMNHFTFVYTEGTIQIYKNGFLYTEKKDAIRFGTIRKTVNQIKLAQHGWISELQYFSESLDEKTIFSLYVNHYRSGVSYDINGGIYTISYPPIDGNDVSFVNYKIENNEPHANTLTVPITGTMSVSETTGSSIDITMDPLQLNEFHKQSKYFDIILDDYGMSTKVDGSNRLYIEAMGFVPDTDHVLEGTTLQLKLENLPELNGGQTRPFYSYTISGENIDESDICGGQLSGTIQETTSIIIRDDYKTEGLETCIISIQELNLATTIDICDNAQNLLSVDKAFVDTDDTFIITMTWPDTWPNYTTLGTSVPYTITRGSDLVIPKISTGIFTRDTTSTGSFTVTSEYTVETVLPQQFFTIELDNFDSKVDVVINDFIIPRITVFKEGEPTVSEINEGEVFEILFEVPINWRTDITEYPYIIEGIKFNVNDISNSSDPNYSGGTDIDISMTGIFTLDFDNNIRNSKFTYTASENLTIESDEVFKVRLLDPIYKSETPSATDISYEIISNDFTVVNTAYQPYYLLTVGGSVDLSGSVYYINEGRTFTISLLTSKVTGTIPYRLTGLEQADLESGTINGVFTLPDITTLSFTLREDTTTEGEENFSFDLIANEIVVSKYFVLVDTSQFPDYEMKGIDTLENKTYEITIINTNHPFMTSLQKAAVIIYQIDGAAVIQNDVKDINGNPVNNIGSFQFNENSEYTITYTYDKGGQFIFTILNFDGLRRQVTLGETIQQNI